MSSNIVSRSLSVHKEHELLLRLEAAGLGDSEAQAVIGSKDNELALQIVELIRSGRPALSQVQPGTEMLAKDWFVPSEAQLEIVRRRNAERKWSFTNKDFDKLGDPPAWPTGQLCPVVLEVVLDTVQNTFEEAWHFAKSVQPDSWRWREVKSDSKHLRLLSGIKRQRGLRWRVVDLAANWDKSDGIRPMDVRNPKTSPHSAILWAASYFPNWIQAIDGVNVPYAWIPGYELIVPGHRPWSYMPFLYWNRGGRRVVRLYADHCDNPHQGWAVPEFRES